MVGEELTTKIQQTIQAAVELPTNVLNLGTKQVQETVGALGAEAQKAMGIITPPPIPTGLPQFPALPGLPTGGNTTDKEPATETRSEATQGLKRKSVKSYLEA